MKNDKPYKITLPTSIDRALIINRLIEQGLQEDAQNDILLDKMLYVCALIHRINIKMYASDAGFEDVYLCSKFMKANMGRSGKVTYFDVLSKLGQIGIIKRGEKYRVKSFSKSHELLIENKLFAEYKCELKFWRPAKRKEGRPMVDGTQWQDLQARFIENIRKLQIDYEYGYNALNNQIQPTRGGTLYISYFFSKLSSGNPDDLYVSRDKNGRVYHNITGAPRFLRPALSLNDKPLFSVDLSGSQLYFAIPGLVAYAKQKAKCSDWSVVCGKFPDVQRYIESVLQGRFYITIMERIEDAESRSSDPKDETIKAIFTKKDLKRKSAYAKAIESEYPTFWAYLASLKKKDYRDAANRLQQLESQVMIDKVCLRLLKEDFWFLPIHDCIVTSEANIQIVTKVIKEEALAATGYVPHYKITQWSGEKLHWAKRETDEDWAEYGKRALEAEAKQAKKRLIKRMRARVT